MPTASTESTEKKGLGEAQTPIKQAIAIVEKKVRNLEKRKNKLDTIKQKAASGCKLEADQRNAIERYDEVIQTLEYSRELQKQFTAISNEAGKLMKKQARREKLERQHHEMKRIQEMLKVQNLLDSLGTDEIRADFQTGKHGAVVLTEENLNHLDELYQLISPTREGEGDYHVKLNTAADHIVSLLEGKNKEVIGTTYKDLKELIDLISGCGYFEVVQKLETEAAKSTEDSVEALPEDQVEGSTEVASSEDGKSESQADETGMDLPVSQLPQETLEQVAPAQLNNMAAPSDSAYFANEVYPQAPCQRPIDEIVSSVQGNFNFLQESTIDVESVAHTDPAVVAAQPMSRQSSQATPDSESRPLSGFGSQTYERQTDPANAQPSQLPTNSRSEPQQRYSTASDQSTHSQQNMDYQSSQPFRQNALSQNLPNDSLFPSPGEDSSQISHGMMNQTGQDSSLTQFDIPPSIPLPQSQENQQSNISNQSEKKFTMNASAPVFQSMYSQQGVQEQGGDGSNHFGQNSDSSGGNYQNNRYQNDGFQQRGPRREGFRNSRGRGSGGGGNNSNMQNGFNRNSSGGGVNQNSGRGGRGGSYQGYPARNNYQPDGYQGYNNSGFNQGYKQRSGSGNNQGQMRGSGSGGGMRGMRGGQARGGGSNNSQRGGGSGPRNSGGNFGRPNTAQYQQ